MSNQRLFYLTQGIGWAIVIITAILLFFSDALAFDLEARGRVNIYRDKSLEERAGAEVRMSRGPFFLWGSCDESQLRLYGQRAGDISLYGIGLGIRLSPVKGLGLWGQGGYYEPTSSMENHPENYHETLGHVFRNLEAQWGVPHLSDHYDYKIQGNLGGAIGADYSYEIYKDLWVSFTAAYRFLKLPETFYESYNGYHNYFEWKESRDFSGGIIGIGLTYRF